MFKLIAVLFAVANGVPSEKPIGVLSYNQKTFPTEKSCVEFAETDEGKAERQKVSRIVQAQRGAIMAVVSCAKAEDNSI
jgi:hypothetical protein